MTSIRSGKTPDAPTPATSATCAAQARGLATMRARLGGHAVAGDRRARAEALADGLLSLLRAVEEETLA